MERQVERDEKESHALTSPLLIEYVDQTPSRLECGFVRNEPRSLQWGVTRLIT